METVRKILRRGAHTPLWGRQRLGVRHRPGVRGIALAVQLGNRELRSGVRDDDELPRLRIRGRRCLQCHRHALLDYLALDRAIEVESFAHGAGCREELVGIERQEVHGQSLPEQSMRAIICGNKRR